MFLDSGAWPPPPDGYEPPRPPARLTRPQERVMLGSIGLFLLVMFIGPLAGSSVIVGLIALFS
ncbi:hypothetical protein ACFQ15_18025 [Sphingomonas hankookensis]|uniref:hypothetical protein n=1 Tax=Sphingomonas hankookensis TaxID=563996 RepID=UPI001F5A6C9D|nr:hypothetical protein [Sphingomonas hankookensis]